MAITIHCVCGSSFVGHAMIVVHHNELCDLTAGWLHKFCHDATVESPLQPLTGESINPASANCHEDARADVHAKGFWGRGQSAFYDIRVFYPMARMAECSREKETHNASKIKFD